MNMAHAQIQQIRDKAAKGQPESQFLLSQICLQNKDFEGMVHWLRKASAKGLADAHAALGHCHEKGLGLERDHVAALDFYGQAIKAGSIPASYGKAELLYKSSKGPERQDEIRSLLRIAVKAGFEPATRTARYLASQSGQSRHDLPDAVALYPPLRNIGQQRYSDDPPIIGYADVLTEVDCAYLVALSRPYLSHSDVIDPASQRGGMVSDVRTSSGTYIPFEIVDIISRYIEWKIVLATEEDMERSEPMSILRYEPGEYYQPHYDYFDPKLKVSKGLLEDGGQRTASAVTYLSAPDAGGGTSFPELSLTVPPLCGSTLWFRNCHADGRIDTRSLHAGDPVNRGEKWVVTKWFREEETSYLEF